MRSSLRRHSSRLPFLSRTRRHIGYFDRTGWIVDSNIVIPLDRLDEMAAEGKIGSVAKTHISFMGAQPDHTLETIRLDTGPAAAKILLEDEVDVVLLTPV